MRYVFITLLFWMWLLPLSARADDTTPVAVPTQPAVVEPTVAPPAIIEPTQAPLPVEQPTQPVQDTGPVTVSGEQSTPVVRVDPGNPSTDVLPPTPVTGQPAPVSPSTQSTGQGNGPSQTQGTGTSPPVSVGTGQPVAPPDTTLPPPDTSQNPDAGVTSLVYQPHSAQAPAQLTCTGKHHPITGPFLVSPYAGWTEVVSFVDHDSPDYSVDGRIVLANGLTANASDGQASDLFPAYWSPALRQYVNYDGHNGYDFDISYQPVLAAGAGKILYAGWNGDSEYVGYGLMVLIQHRDGYVTLYGHLSKLEVKTGDPVTAGEEIGISGTTGHSSGPHLHFSVFHDCQVTDPYGWTGHGRDPLTDFDGEQASYLWLPSHDPLLLNPPPGWPAYPLGLHIALPPDTGSSTGTNSRIPPVDRLLLLALPSPHNDGTVSAAVALARTEASVTQEAEAIVPQLDDLKAQGVVQNYQVIPAAGAVWVRGSASASQLEGLNGVASLAGVQPRDLEAAQAGLAHSVLIQIGLQQAPSLWPVGFRSAVHAWRPIVTVVAGHALMAGFTLPGQRVVISLQRGSGVPGAAEAQGDPQTGGFVATIHDPLGSPISIRPGDTVQVQSGGRESVARVPSLSVRARPSGVVGSAQAGSSVSLTVLPSANSARMRLLVTAGTDGALSYRASRTLPAGTLVIANVVDRAGNSDATTSYVPGVLATVGGSNVSGWTVGKSPVLTVIRHGATLNSRHLTVAPDGTFNVDLERAGAPYILRPGDSLQIGSPWHHHRILLPPVSATLQGGAHSFRLLGPHSASLHVQLSRADGTVWSATVRIGNGSSATVDLPAGSAVALGDSVSAEYVLGSGDRVRTQGGAEGLLVREGTAHISGQVRPGVPVSIHLIDRAGRSVAGGVTTADPATGSFSVSLRDAHGRKVKTDGGQHLLVRDGAQSTSMQLPAFPLSFDRSTGRLTGGVTGKQRAILRLEYSSGISQTRPLAGGAAGISTQISTKDRSALQRILLTESMPGGITVQREMKFARRPAPARCAKVHDKSKAGASGKCSTGKAR